MFSIYMITNTITKKHYIGYTNNVNRRWANHKCNAKFSKGCCVQLYQSMRKHGIDNFVLSILEENIDSVDVAKQLEVKYIHEYDTFIRGYNAHPGGTGGDMSSYPNWRKAIAEVHKNKDVSEYSTYGMLGKTHSDETKQKQSEARKKEWESMSVQELEERSSKIKGSKNGMFGKTPKNSLKIQLYGIIYHSIAEAVRKTGHSAAYVKKHGTLL